MSFDLHVHSVYSLDSLMHPKTIVKIAKKVMLNGLAITDHDTIKGALAVSKLAPSSMIAIAGCEISTALGHVTGLFLNEEIKTRDPLEVLDKIRAQGGVSVIAHYFKDNSVKDEKFKEMLTKIDAIEILNSRTPMPSANVIGELKLLNKIFLAGSDAHLPYEIGLCRLLVASEMHDAEELRKTILAKSAYGLVGKIGLKHWQTISSIVWRARTGNLSILPYESLRLGRDLWIDIKHNFKSSKALTIYKL